MENSEIIETEEIALDARKLRLILWKSFVLQPACPICKSKKISKITSDALNYNFNTEEFYKRWIPEFTKYQIESHFAHHTQFSEFALSLIKSKNKHSKKNDELESQVVSEEDLKAIQGGGIFGDFKQLYRNSLIDVFYLKNSAIEKYKSTQKLDWHRQALSSVGALGKNILEMDKLQNSKSHELIQQHLEFLRLSLMQAFIDVMGNFNRSLTEEFSDLLGAEKTLEIFYRHIPALQKEIETTWTAITSSELNSIEGEKE